MFPVKRDLNSSYFMVCSNALIFSSGFQAGISNRRMPFFFLYPQTAYFHSILSVSIYTSFFIMAGFNRQVQHPRIWQKPQQEFCNRGL
jgi:hypothetical protein